ncbi:MULTISPECIES: hypothetical protein [Roseobacteraceae]|jgi:hypothetical protein|uniref:Uncharacterized protein n=1 Tax=Pseudosulfitobacter pseudonitzschiae TaxID=1402135 RepID=A0A221K1E4_9RHOB|nr:MULTISPECIES: hypothetical protein [Roseobacteraceae]ASM72791.1 hypothetical protein SULPSESMR1_01986 [Pseudosulfitobacter pseudonitzschiae]
MLDILVAIIAMAGGGDDAPPPKVSATPPPAIDRMAGADETRGNPTPTLRPDLVAEEQVATGKFLTALEVKPILTATKSSWVAVRDYNGQDLVYVTHLWSWRCGLLQIEMALNGGAMEVWPMPACHLDSNAPAAITDADGLPYRVFAAGSVQQLDVRITYDDLSVDTISVERKAVLMP